MNHYFVEKFKTPPGLETPSNKVLLDKFESLLVVDVYLYTAMLKSKLIEFIPFELYFEVEKLVLEDITEQYQKTNKKMKRNKEAEKLLIEHYNNLLDVPFDKSVFNEVHEIFWDLDVPISELLILLVIIHTTIAFTIKDGINLINALSKVFNDEYDSRIDYDSGMEGMYV